MVQSMRTHVENTRTHGLRTYRSRNNTACVFRHWSTLCQLFLFFMESFLNSLDPDRATSLIPASTASRKFVYSGLSSTLFCPLSVNHSAAAVFFHNIFSAFSNITSGFGNRYVPDCMQWWMTFTTGCFFPVDTCYKRLRTHGLKHEDKWLNCADIWFEA